MPATPDALMRLAVETGADVERLDKLMQLQERWQAGQARQAFLAALADFQRDCPALPKTKEVKKRDGGLLYKFAPLPEICATISATEHTCGFTHRFDQEDHENGAVTVKCIIAHRAGHAETTSVTIPPTKGQNTNEAQNKGIMISYGRRYALCGAYGMVTGDPDTDGNVPPEMISADQAVEFAELAEQTGTDLGPILAWMGCDSCETMPAGPKYEQAVAKLRKLSGPDADPDVEQELFDNKPRPIE